MKFVFASATFFWVSCGDESSSVSTQNNDAIDSSSSSSANTSSSFGSSSSSDDGTSSAFDSSSSNYDPDDWIPPMSSTAYGIQPTYNHSSSSVESSSSSIDDEGIPSMSETVYGSPIPCYTTSIEDASGSTYAIFECRSGIRYLKDFVMYDEALKEKLPKDLKWDYPDTASMEGANCSPGPDLCVDKVDENGNPTGGCFPTLECPPKDE